MTTLIGAPYVGPPASYTRGRLKPIMSIGLHCTEGSEGPTSAEAGVAYDKRRDDGTSCHEFTDSNNALCEVRATDRSHAARRHGNEIGYQIEMCQRAGQTPGQWADAASRATIDITAQRVAALMLEWGWSESCIRRLTVAEVRAGYYSTATAPRGICEHYDYTKAFPEDGGDHTDVGPNFPWSTFLGLVRSYYRGAGPAPESETEMRFLFRGFPDQTGLPGDPSMLVHRTAAGVTYNLQPAPGEFSAIGDKAGAGPIVTIKPADVPEEYRTYAAAVTAVCGRLDTAPTGVADHKHAVSVAVSGSGSGSTGPVQPAA